MIPKKSKIPNKIIKIKNRSLKNNNPKKSQNNHNRNNRRKNSKVKAISKRNKNHKKNKNSKIKMINQNKKRDKKKKNRRKSKNQSEVNTHQLLNLYLLLYPIPKKVRLNRNKLTVKKDYFLYFCTVLRLLLS